MINACMAAQSTFSLYVTPAEWWKYYAAGAASLPRFLHTSIFSRRRSLPAGLLRMAEAHNHSAGAREREAGDNYRYLKAHDSRPALHKSYTRTTWTFVLPPCYLCVEHKYKWARVYTNCSLAKATSLPAFLGPKVAQRYNILSAYLIINH